MTPPEIELGARVDKLAASVNGLREAHEENTAELRTKQAKSDRALRATRRQGIVLAVVSVVGFVVLVGLIGWLRQDAIRRNNDRDAALIISCLNDNESRSAIEQRFEQMIAQLGSFNAPADPVAAAARQQLIDRFVAEFRESMPAALQARDCSERAATQPTLVPTTTIRPG